MRGPGTPASPPGGGLHPTSPLLERESGGAKPGGRSKRPQNRPKPLEVGNGSRTGQEQAWVGRSATAGAEEQAFVLWDSRIRPPASSQPSRPPPCTAPPSPTPRGARPRRFRLLALGGIGDKVRGDPGTWAWTIRFRSSNRDLGCGDRGAAGGPTADVAGACWSRGGGRGPGAGCAPWAWGRRSRRERRAVATVELDTLEHDDTRSVGGERSLSGGARRERAFGTCSTSGGLRGRPPDPKMLHPRAGVVAVVRGRTARWSADWIVAGADLRCGTAVAVAAVAGGAFRRERERRALSVASEQANRSCWVRRSKEGPPRFRWIVRGRGCEVRRGMTRSRRRCGRWSGSGGGAGELAGYADGDPGRGDRDGGEHRLFGMGLRWICVSRPAPPEGWAARGTRAPGPGVEAAPAREVPLFGDGGPPRGSGSGMRWRPGGLSAHPTQAGGAAWTPAGNAGAV